MRCDVVITGVGGQGVLATATVIGRAALATGLHVKQPEVHGMAQRGGSVQCHLRLADAPIWSDLIPRAHADLILAMEPMEALRCLPWLKPEGWVVTSRTPVHNLSGYPPDEELWAEIGRLPRHVLFDATRVAQDHGLPRSANVALAGAASPFLPLTAASLETAIARQFHRLGQAAVDANLAVFRAARAIGGEAAARRPDSPAA